MSHKCKLPPWVAKVLDRVYCLTEISTNKCTSHMCDKQHCSSLEQILNVRRALAEKKRAKYGECPYGKKCHSTQSKDFICKKAHSPDRETDRAWMERRVVNPIYDSTNERWCIDEIRKRKCRFPNECKRRHHNGDLDLIIQMMRDDANERSSHMFGEAIYISDEE